MALGLKLAHHLQQKPTKKCHRCGLRYSETDEKCAHCGDLNEAELKELKDAIEEHHESNRNLGALFMVIATIVCIGIIIFVL